MTRAESSGTEKTWTSGQAAARRKALTDAGMERPVAETLVDLLDEQAAPMMTRAEADARFAAMLDRHDAQRAQERAEFRGEMEARFAQVDARLAELKGEMHARFGEVNGRFGSVEGRMTGAGRTGAHAEVDLRQPHGLQHAASRRADVHSRHLTQDQREGVYCVVRRTRSPSSSIVVLE